MPNQKPLNSISNLKALKDIIMTLEKEFRHGEYLYEIESYSCFYILHGNGESSNERHESSKFL